VQQQSLTVVPPGCQSARPGMGPAVTEVGRVTSGKHSHSQEKGNTFRLTLVPGASWYWRLCSLLMLALLASILIPRPSAALAATAGPKAPPKPELNVLVIGDFYSYGYATSADKTLRDSAPPTLQALNQVQAANPGVQMDVLFIPVSDATSASLFAGSNAGTPAAQPPLIRTVRQADVVIVGLGGENDNLAASMRNVLFGTGVTSKSFSGLMASFDNGTYLQAQTDLLDAIAAQAAPGTSIITLGYPNMLGEQLPSGFTWWSPFTWATVSQQQANMSDQLVSALDTANQQATSIAAARYSGLHFLYANLPSAMQGQGPFGSRGQGHTSTVASTPGSQLSGPTQAIISNDLVPYVNQAVNNELVAKNLPSPQNIAPITPATRWNLAVEVPSPALSPSPPQQPGSEPGGNAPVSNTLAHNSQDNPIYPAYRPPSPPSSPVSQPPYTGLGGSLQPGGDQPSISIPLLPSVRVGVSVGVGDQGPGDQQQGGHLPGSSAAASQRTPQPQPTGTSQPSPGGNPTSASGQNPSTEGQNGTTPTSAGHTPSSQSPKTPQVPVPITLPLIPAPPAPLPEPIAPKHPPALADNPGTDASPSGGATGIPGNTPSATAPSGRTPAGGTTPATTPATVGATTAPATPGTATTAPASPAPASPAPATPGTGFPVTLPNIPASATPGTGSPGTGANGTGSPAPAMPSIPATPSPAPATTGTPTSPMTPSPAPATTGTPTSPTTPSPAPATTGTPTQSAPSTPATPNPATPGTGSPVTLPNIPASATPGTGSPVTLPNIPASATPGTGSPVTLPNIPASATPGTGSPVTLPNIPASATPGTGSPGTATNGTGSPAPATTGTPTSPTTSSSAAGTTGTPTSPTTSSSAAGTTGTPTQSAPSAPATPNPATPGGAAA
jgi:hypothetical protein